MKLRWVTFKNRTTADGVRAYREFSGLSQADAFKKLEDADGPYLQVWREDWQDWDYVDNVIEYRDKPTVETTK